MEEGKVVLEKETLKPRRGFRALCGTQEAENTTNELYNHFEVESMHGEYEHIDVSKIIYTRKLIKYENKNLKDKTIDRTSIGMLCVTAQFYGWKIKGMDVEGTFLQGKGTNREVFIKCSK